MVPTELDYHVVDHRDDIAWVTLDRPAAQHSLTIDMAEELQAVTAWAADATSVRAIVLTGSEGRFCTGADLRAFEGDHSDERRLWGIARRLHGVIGRLATAPKPVITAVEGVAAGGGLGLALAGDLVYLAADARLEFAYPRLGLSGDGGISYLLPRLVGLRNAREIALRDEPIEAARAVDLGLATEAIDPDHLEATVEDVATDLAAGPTRAYGRFKQLTWDGLARSFEDQLRAEVEVISRLARTEDYVRGYENVVDGADNAFVGQ